MRIELLGAESLGVRGLACAVEADGRRIVIDPGLALGYHRNGLLPHPAQVAVGECVRRRILDALDGATDVVMSHLHGDHVPLPDANPYQLKAQSVASLSRSQRLWVKGRRGLSSHMVARRRALSDTLDRTLPVADGETDGPLAFSPPVAHGEPHTHLGTVIMTRVKDALVGGPPLYLSDFLGARRRERAWRNAERLARSIDTLILDHHLLRCEEGLSWLDRLSSKSGHRVMCAADFMEQPRCLLEARREALYQEMPVPAGWHEAYARGEADTSGYRRYVGQCT